MVIKTITRSYSKSINTKDYGLTDSWLKVESSMTAEITEEEQEQIKELSNELQAMTKADVTSTIKDIATRMKEDAAKRANPVITTNPAFVPPTSIAPGSVVPVTAPLTRPTKHL